jgi:surface protein
MESMFLNAQVFDQPLDDWDVSSVTTMRLMFRQTDAFSQPLNAWNYRASRTRMACSTTPSPSTSR